MKFSERVGAREPPKQIQLESMDDALRASLWNEVAAVFEDVSVRAARALARNLFKTPADEVPDSESRAYTWMRNHFFEGAWHQVYDIVEYLGVNVDAICNVPTPYQNFYRDQRTDFLNRLNFILERELSGYRFIRGQLVPISNPAEVDAIEEAASNTAAAGLKGAQRHIFAALGFLGQKPEPHYRNSVKESISAVESVVNVVTGGKGGGVAEAVEKLASVSEIHGALKAAVKQLYGYTSDSGGIRHAILDQPTVTFEEAKFMLVVCSAFVNFMIGKARQGGLV